MSGATTTTSIRRLALAAIRFRLTMRLPTTLLLCSLSLGLVNAQDTAKASSTDSAGASTADPKRPESLRLLQRIFHPSRPSEPFVDRGSLLLSYPSTQGTSHGPTSATFVPSEENSIQSYVVSYVDVSQDEAESEQGPVDIDAAVYQLALEHPGDKHSSQWHVSSVRAVRPPLFFPSHSYSISIIAHTDQ